LQMSSQSKYKKNLELGSQPQLMKKQKIRLTSNNKDKKVLKFHRPLLKDLSRRYQPKRNKRSAIHLARFQSILEGKVSKH
jgi:hypothetical protein